MEAATKLHNLLLLSLACWRLTYMLVWEDGPWEVIKRFREWSGIVEDGTGSENGWSPLGCMYCTSVWVAGILMILPSWVSKLLAISALAIIVEGRRR